MPDALSKTIPIWCAVFNSFLFPNESHKLYTPRNVVSESEHAQITVLITQFLESLRSLGISQAVFRSQITKPLRPMWVTPESQITTESSIFSDFHPIICCTVSRRVSGAEISERGYIQGAGDDTENWAFGLTPSIYWKNQRRILSTPENDVQMLIEDLVDVARDTSMGEGHLRCVKPTSRLYLGPISAILPGAMAASCFIILLPTITKRDSWLVSSSKLEVGLGPQKIGSRNLREALESITAFAGYHLHREERDGSLEHRKSMVIACESGKDLSVGAALALLCFFFDEEGNLRKGDLQEPKIDKDIVRRRLAWISTSMPDANPSRATLQSVNSFLMRRP